MFTSRRQFLRLFVVAAGGAAVAGTVITQWPYRLVRELYHLLTEPVLSSDTRAGPLHVHTLETLLAVTEAVLDPRIEKRHYADFFQWYAENIQGYKEFYEQVTARLDRIARRAGTEIFSASDTATRQAILEHVFLQHRNRFHRMWAAVFERDRLLFERYLIAPMVELFAKTDAWTLLGYAYWPGQPRGLQRYTQVPMKQENTSHEATVR
jgi:hypothetical protein